MHKHGTQSTTLSAMATSGPHDLPGDAALVDALCVHFRHAVPIDAREQASIEEFLTVVPQLVAPFDEHTDIRHVTASAIVVGRRGVVLHLHKRLGLWLQPGGHIDAGEHPAQAAVREAVEELGMAVAHPADGPQLIHVDVHPGPRGHRHYDVRYLLIAGDEDPQPGPDESPHARWFAPQEAFAVADPGLHGGLTIGLRTYVRYCE
jgi:8-oxo-dGTP pyrophosphatase MutT (NUDIX family)